MTTTLAVSVAVLWVVVLVLAGVVVALTRQIGVLYERIAPVGALMTASGPSVGAAAPVMPVEDLTGRALTIGGAHPSGRNTLLLFLSPTCPVCKELLPSLDGVRRSERATLDVVLASDGPREEHERFVREQALAGLPYVLSTALGVRYQVGKLPYAVLIDGAGVVRAKGLVNTREHLDSLLEALTLGVVSIQEYLQAHPELGGHA